MTHNDTVLDFMITQLRSHLQTAYVPVNTTAAPKSSRKDQALIHALRGNLQEMEDANRKLQHDFKAATDGVLRRNEQIQQLKEETARKDVQLAACHENQKNYRAEITQLKEQIAHQQGQISEGNRVNQELRDELNVMRKKEFGAAVGVKDVNKLLESFRAVSNELVTLKKQSGIPHIPAEEQRWDGSVEIGSPWHKDAC